MGGKESAQVDSEYFEKISFHINILVCGDYPEQNIESDLDNINILNKDEESKFIKKGVHKNIPDWNYFFFKKDNNIGNNTRIFLMNSIKKLDYKSLILFYSGLKKYTYNDLLQFYDGQSDSYQINTIIVTKKMKNLYYQN